MHFSLTMPRNLPLMCHAIVSLFASWTYLATMIPRGAAAAMQVGTPFVDCVGGYDDSGGIAGN